MLTIKISPEHLDLTKEFFEKAANILFENWPQDLCLVTYGTLLFKPLYGLSQIKLEILQEYISDNFIKRFIQTSTSSAIE